MLLNERQDLISHPLYKSLKSPEALRTFMKFHVFCVWDFQSLAKRLQQICSPTSFPWMPGENMERRRLMNEIILEEETDVDPDGGYCSHFELYVKAMKHAGADTSLIDQLFAQLAKGMDVMTAVNFLPEPVQNFLKTSFNYVYNGSDHQVCAAFTKGRETIIPDMFTAIVAELANDQADEWQMFHYYLQRHIEVDGGEHGPASEKLLASFCPSPKEASEADATAQKSLQVRNQLWDFILKEI